MKAKIKRFFVLTDARRDMLSGIGLVARAMLYTLLALAWVGILFLFMDLGNAAFCCFLTIVLVCTVRQWIAAGPK
jgi:polyferredoxin